MICCRCNTEWTPENFCKCCEQTCFRCCATWQKKVLPLGKTADELANVSLHSRWSLNTRSRKVAYRGLIGRRKQ